MWPNVTADLVTFTEEILNGKLHFRAVSSKEEKVFTRKKRKIFILRTKLWNGSNDKRPCLRNSRLKNKCYENKIAFNRQHKYCVSTSLKTKKEYYTSLNKNILPTTSNFGELSNSGQVRQQHISKRWWYIVNIGDRNVTVLNNFVSDEFKHLEIHHSILGLSLELIVFNLQFWISILI